MRPLHSLLVAVLVAALCAAGWFLVGSSDRKVEVASAAPGTAAPAGAAAVSEQGSLHAPRPAEAGGERSELAPAPEAPAQASQSAAATAEAGTVAVQGRVVDETGAPVGGARVLAAGGNSGLHLIGDFALDARGAGSMPWLKRSETTSGADGRFTLHGLRPGNLRLAVRGPGFAPRDDERALPSGASFDLGDIELEPGVYVAGKVVDARGRAVEGAQVLRLSRPSTSEFGAPFGGTGAVVATSAADGSFAVDQLAVGAWALRIESEVHPHAKIGRAHV